jgi:hypothetical protein
MDWPVRSAPLPSGIAVVVIEVVLSWRENVSKNDFIVHFEPFGFDYDDNRECRQEIPDPARRPPKPS